MGPTYVPFPDGRSLTLTEDPAVDHAELSKFSKKDAAAMPRYDAWLKGVADVLAPLLLRAPPRVGSTRPADLIGQLRLAWGLRGLDVRGTADAVRLFTMSIADLLDEWFEDPQVKGVVAINGVIGTWAGPAAPGTAYVMMHHSIGTAGGGRLGSWGYPIGGMGAVAEAIRRSAEAFRGGRPDQRTGRADPGPRRPGYWRGAPGRHRALQRDSGRGDASAPHLPAPRRA
jgi:phytoene dehydrogenase-like protein